MALEVEGLPHLETAPDEPRLFETWLPSKVIKAYSLRYSCHPCKCNCLFLPYLEKYNAFGMLSVYTSSASWHSD